MDDYSSTPIGEYSVYKRGTGKPSVSYTVGSSTTAVANKNGTKIEKGELDYGVGDRVRHIKFKEGTVKDIVDEGRDYEVTVEFDGVGVKKMLASFAKLQKI
jgi:DNA helicase-2/ATP-dependent DNA helicase PcrA